MNVSVNGAPVTCETRDDLTDVLDRIHRLPDAELWLSVMDGPAVCLLKSGDHACLTYLRRDGDSGFTTVGDGRRAGTFRVRLANGQVDEYPLAWCVDPEQAYEALTYFLMNGGAMTPDLSWEQR